MRKYRTQEDREEIIKILEQKPEIDKKVKYYKETMLGIDGVMSAIDERIARGYTTEKFKFLGIPVEKRVYLDEYDKSKLILEKKRAELDLWEKKRYFDMWLQRSKDYDKKFAELKAECEANYDSIYAQAEEARKTNLRLNDVMSAYKNENNDIKIKVEYYLYLRQEVENAIKHGKLNQKLAVQQ